MMGTIVAAVTGILGLCVGYVLGDTMRRLERYTRRRQTAVDVVLERQRIR